MSKITHSRYDLTFLLLLLFWGLGTPFSVNNQYLGGEVRQKRKEKLNRDSFLFFEKLFSNSTFLFLCST